MAKLNIQTGAAAFDRKSSSSTRIGFFKTDIPYTFLSLKSPCQGAILPAFDPRYSENDPARLTSVGSYREDILDKSGDHNEFSKWIIPLPVYTYYGKAWSMIISPTVLGLPDPISDLRQHIKFRRKNDADLQRLIQLPQNASRNDKLALPYYSTMGFCNAWCNPTYIPEGSTDTGDANRVLILSRTATQRLFDDLNEYRPAFMTTPNDEHWPNYKYGDVTNPECALRFTSSSMPTTNGGSACCLSFGGSSPKSMPVRFRITKDMLAGRVDLEDDSVLNIPSYEELVELLIAEGEVPYDLLDEVCSEKYAGVFPKCPGATSNPPSARPDTPETPAPAPKKASGYTPAAYQPEEEGDDIDYTPSPAPARQQPAPVADPAPAPAPAAAPAVGGLSDKEEEEYQTLLKKMLAGDANINEIQRYQALKTARTAK